MKKKAGIISVTVIAVVLVLLFVVFPMTKLYWTTDDMGILNGSTNSKVYAIIPRLTRISEKDTDFRMEILDVSADFYDANGFVNYAQAPEITDIKYGYNKVEYTLTDNQGGAQWRVSVHYGLIKSDVEYEVLKYKTYTDENLSVLNNLLKDDTVKAEITLLDRESKKFENCNGTETVSDKVLICKMVSAIETAEKVRIEPDSDKVFEFKCVIGGTAQDESVTLSVGNGAVEINGVLFEIDTNTYNAVCGEVSEILKNDK